MEQKLANLLTNKKRLLFISLILAAAYFAFFSKLSNFTDRAELARDSWSYQSIGVNFAKGHGFHRVGKMLPFEQYKFQEGYNKRYHNKFLIYRGIPDLQRNLGYPLFVSITYSIFGVSPLVLKNIQLLLLVLIAACLPVLGSHYWDMKGYLSGLIAGPLFLLSSYQLSAQIMSETLMMFTIFIIVVGHIYYEKKQSSWAATMLGILLGISLLVKGSFIFIPLLIGLQMGYSYMKTREAQLLKNASLIVLFSVLTCVPWSIYVNRTGAEVKEKLTAVKNVILDEQLTQDERQSAIENDISLGIGFLPQRALTTEEIQIFHDSLVPAIDRGGYMLNDTILNPLDRVALLKQATAIPEFNLLRVFVVQNLLLDGHNEYMKDGGWYPDWRSDSTSFYNTDGLESKSAPIRVLNFYWKHPWMVFQLAWMKMISAMEQFKFLWLICAVLILERLVNLFRDAFESKAGTMIAFLASLPITIAPWLIDDMSNAATISLMLLFALILETMLREEFSSLKAPRIFGLIFLNFVVIVLIGTGVPRWTVALDFLITLTGVQFFMQYVYAQLIANDG